MIATATLPYFKLRWLQLKPSLNNKENEEFVKKVVVNSLETIYQYDSPENSAISDVDEFYGISKKNRTKSSSEMLLFFFFEDPENSLKNVKKHTDTNMLSHSEIYI